MSTKDLINEIEKNEYILPKDILEGLTEAELINEIEEIFNKHKKKLENDVLFRQKYTELVNYIFVTNVYKPKKNKKKEIFDKKIIKYLLSATAA